MMMMTILMMMMMMMMVIVRRMPKQMDRTIYKTMLIYRIKIP